MPAISASNTLFAGTGSRGNVAHPIASSKILAAAANLNMDELLVTETTFAGKLSEFTAAEQINILLAKSGDRKFFLKIMPCKKFDTAIEL